MHRAKTASGPEARAAHRGLAAGYAARIRALRADLGATVSEQPHVS